jgi:predicted NBD/HSP70 family sugar kinase
MREHHLALVLRHVAAQPGPVTRSDLASATGLTRATVAGLVDDLVSGGLVSEVDPLPRTGAGRPATGLALATTGLAGLGLEINVDYLAACVLDLTGGTRMLRVQHRDQRGRRPSRVLADLARLASAATGEAAEQQLRIAGISVGVPGLVNGDGVVRMAPNLGWQDVDVAGTLGAALSDGVALSVENEANLAALAELHAHPDPRPSFVYVSGEIGVGAGLVLEGKLLRGPRGYGGELGHVTIRPDGRPCRCGARGCLEAYTNQEALLRAAGLSTSTVDDPLGLLQSLAASGDSVVLRALEAAGTALGVAAADVVNLVDVDTVVLGGIFAPLTPWLAGPAAREISDRTVTSGWAPVTIRAAALGTTATVVGAAGSVVRAIREAPAAWLAAT